MRSPLKTLAAFLAILGGLAVVGRPPASLQPLVATPWTPRTTAGLASGLVEVGRDRRAAWTLHTPGSLSLQATIPAEASLRFAMSVDPPSAPVRLRVLVERAGAIETLADEAWKPGAAWAEYRVDLRRLAGASEPLEIAVEGADASVSIAHPALLGRSETPPGPNVILYVVDCLRADHVGAYGYRRPTTPEIDNLARDGVVFESVHACASWTKPAVGCLFTSLYPVFHGAQTIDDVMDPGNPTLAEAFRSRGYATAAWVANPFVAANPFGLTRGFDDVVQVIDKPPLVNINDLPADAADITKQVVPWLHANADRQFFLYLHSLDLHAEYRRRPPFAQKFLSPDRTGDARQVDLYDNELAYNDREIGRLVQALKREGLYQRTIVVVTADHGEEFGEHGFTRHGHTLFEALLHVPLVVKLPDSAQRGRRVAALASSLDIAPTLLDLAGGTVPHGFRGLSLRGVVDRGGTLPRRTVFAEQLSPKEVLYAGRDLRFKYIQQLIPSPAEMLFDLGADPSEERNLLPAAPEAAQGLMSEVREFLQLGQAGYHVSIASPQPTSRFTLRVMTTGVLADVQRFALAAGERLVVSPDRKRLDYDFSAGAATRHLVIRTEPAAADVRITLEKDGRLVPAHSIALGPEGTSPATADFTPAVDVLRASVPQGAELLKPGGAPIKVWYIPAPSGARKATIDPDLQEKLKALGYIE